MRKILEKLLNEKLFESDLAVSINKENFIDLVITLLSHYITVLVKTKKIFMKILLPVQKIA
jgi:hypothetical protein